MWVYILAAVILTAVAWQDAVSHTIPNYMIVLLLVCGALQGLLEDQLFVRVIGMAVCGGPALALAVTVKHASVGGGDVKLCAAFGALLGPIDGSLVILLALVLLSVWGIVGRKAARPIPYGPFALPAYLAVIFLQWKGLI